MKIKLENFSLLKVTNEVIYQCIMQLGHIFYLYPQTLSVYLNLYKIKQVNTHVLHVIYIYQFECISYKLICRTYMCTYSILYKLAARSGPIVIRHFFNDIIKSN